ncbi:MAG TPA: HAMP domain-containing sensor histidine kinase [Saprospiraceae bacterium]|nr:HAMP domain-containing histidine kinase [Saprospiraceae bacterium]MCB9327952.1 HAMP domain-containing histidine kinase [Lewinellaceae bacterium]HPK09144.1 HAMP domain-containing sensor histidine kinase [Saprospiraceae bacterium]HRX28560.1 HAMP domain-containing sensor histidine kinase [Saprospiraceae bacterium]
MTKLLHKPLRAFVIYALIILSISIPVYVFIIDYIWINELDENNWITLQQTKEKFQSHEFTPHEIQQLNSLWGIVQPGISIEENNKSIPFQDSVYEVTRTNLLNVEDHKDRFRGLKSQVIINGDPYILTIETNVEESDDTFLAIATTTAIFFNILILGFIILNRIISTKLWKPFDLTLKQLRLFELSKESKMNLPQSDILEFQELNKTLEKMVNNNLRAYQQQKKFTENASHELQTPIALLKSKLDLLFQQKDISSEISRILNDIEAPLSRLSRINKNLILLARVENQQFQLQQENDIKALFQTALILFEDYICEKELILNIKIEERILVNANHYLLETMVNNLISNAIRHTPIGGEIIISCSSNSIQIANTGNQRLNTDFMFERFSMSSDNKISSGLGLAIIKEIVVKNNWSLEYLYRDKFHIFLVSF